MLIVQSLQGRHIYEDEVDAWSGPEALRLNETCTLRALDPSAAEPDKYDVLVRAVAKTLQGVEEVARSEAEPRIPGRVY